MNFTPPPQPQPEIDVTDINYAWSANFFKFCAFEIWFHHLDWLKLMGFERAHEKIHWQPELLAGKQTNHEVVDLLAGFIEHTGYGNAHLGLTSSDVVDNVRLAQIRASVKIINWKVWQVVQHLNERFNYDVETVGYTHLVPAAPVSWRHRKDAWTQPLISAVAMSPVITAKKFGGPVGDARALQALVTKQQYEDNPFDWAFLDLEYPGNPYPLQSSDHRCEMAAVNWAAVIAAQIHKIAQDLRHLYAFGHVVILPPRDEAGSSSMPHKINPYKWEKVNSMCRTVGATMAEMWSVAAQNSLERTLDTSWQIKSLLPRCFVTLVRALEEITKPNVHIDHLRCADDVQRQGRKLGSDMELLRRVVEGESRWTAYTKMLQEKNTK